MSKTTIKELALSLSEKHDLSQADAERFVATLFEVINEGLEDEKLVKVKGLGAFKIIGVAARKSVDVNTGEPIVIEGRNKISFTPDASMRDDVNKPFAQFETVVINDGVDFSSIDKEYENGTETASEKKAEVRLESVEESHENAVEPLDTVAESPEKIDETRIAESSEKIDEARIAESPEKIDEARIAESPEKIDETRIAESPEKIVENQAKIDEVPGTVAETPKNSVDNSYKTEETATEEDAAISEPEVGSSSQKPIEENIEQQKEQTSRDIVEEASTSKTANAVEDEAEGDTSTERKTLEKDAVRSEVKEESDRELIDEEAHQNHALKALVVTAVVIVIGCLCGGYYLFSQIQKRDNHIEMLEKQMKLVAQHQNNGQKNSNKAAKPNQQATKASQGQDSTSQQVNGSKQATSQVPQAEDKSSALRDNASLRDKAKPANPQVDNKQAALQEQYDKDVRIRTGAYVIVGIKKTVTVHSGQTMDGISRSNLGPGMECYLEAVNGGKRELKAGESIKIPELKLKKRRR